VTDGTRPPIRGHLPKLLGAKEVASLLGITQNRLYDLGKRGLIPTVRIGKQVRYPEDKLRAWIEQGGMPLPNPGDFRRQLHRPRGNPDATSGESGVRSPWPGSRKSD
jgi:excisionase family DNA binding protein